MFRVLKVCPFAALLSSPSHTTSPDTHTTLNYAHPPTHHIRRYHRTPQTQCFTSPTHIPHITLPHSLRTCTPSHRE